MDKIAGCAINCDAWPPKVIQGLQYDVEQYQWSCPLPGPHLHTLGAWIPCLPQKKMLRLTPQPSGLEPIINYTHACMHAHTRTDTHTSSIQQVHLRHVAICFCRLRHVNTNTHTHTHTHKYNTYMTHANSRHTHACLYTHKQTCWHFRTLKHVSDCMILPILKHTHWPYKYMLGSVGMTGEVHKMYILHKTFKCWDTLLKILPSSFSCINGSTFLIPPQYLYMYTWRLLTQHNHLNLKSVVHNF